MHARKKGEPPRLALINNLLSRRSRNIVAIEIHHFSPSSREVLHKLLLGIRARINFRKSTQLRLRTEDQIDASSRPLDLVRLPVAPFVQALRNPLNRTRSLPLRIHVEQVDEEIIRQRLRLVG